MPRHAPMPAPLMPAVLIAALAATCFLAAPVAAQDAAAIGGQHYDPAFVGGGRAMPINAPASPSVPPVSEAAADAAIDQVESSDQIEALLGQVRGRLNGGASDSPGADTADALRYRYEAENLIRSNWDKLSPLTRTLYTDNYDRDNPNDGNRSTYPYIDPNQDESKLLGGARNAERAMQNLEELLLPMIKDVKQGFDNELRQRSNRR
jgi:hypothetical protein